jgi:sugar phosphate isomerase/epimerase
MTAPASPTRPIQLELCWGTLSQVDVVGQIRAAAAAGFGCVTISPSQYLEFIAANGNGAALVRAALDETGVRATIVDCLMSGLPGSPDPDSAPPQFRSMFEVTADDCFAILDAVGGEAMQVAHFQGAPVPVGTMADAIGALTDRARSRGFGVLIEFMPGTGIPDYPTAGAIVHAVDDDRLAVTFDTWHFARTGGNEAELETTSPAVVGGLQLNDTPMPAAEMAQLGYVPMSDRLLPGEGMFPVDRVLATILAAGRPVRAGIEVFSSRLRELPAVEAARVVRDATAGMLERIGYAAS